MQAPFHLPLKSAASCSTERAISGKGILSGIGKCEKATTSAGCERGEADAEKLFPDPIREPLYMIA